MSEESVEIVRAAYASFAEGDMAAVLERLDPDIVSYTAAPLPDPVEHAGHAGFLRWVEDWTGAFDEFAIEIEDEIQSGDTVVLRVRQQATGAASGATVEQTFWLVHALRDGRIARVGIHATESQALEAGGVKR